MRDTVTRFKSLEGKGGALHAPATCTMSNNSSKLYGGKGGALNAPVLLAGTPSSRIHCESFRANCCERAVSHHNQVQVK
jgi:hypothetical protein